MGRPFRLASERRQIAPPSYGGEREPDSHPTPGPPTFVQSARVQLLLRERRRGAARGLSVPWVGSSRAGRLDRRGAAPVLRPPRRFARAAGLRGLRARLPPSGALSGR